jgi:hypothetical protein
MSLSKDRLYQLLPALYRLRDDAQGKPLEALLSLFARELTALEENLDQLYDDQFIETCAEWAAPYVGQLIGYRPLHGVAPRVASPRAEVANTIAFRRRKGTALMLEELAHDVTDWPARAVEFFEQLATTQYMNHVRPPALATAAIRSQRLLLDVGGPFNAVAHTAEVRRPETGSGRYNIPNVGIFLWRLRPLALTGLPLLADPADTTGRRFRVNPLGADLPLFRAPRSEPGIDHLAGRVNVPAPLAVREFALQVRSATQGGIAVPSSDDYGVDRSVVLSRDGIAEPLRNAGVIDPAHPDALRVVRIADLRDVFDGGGTFVGWAHEDDIDAHQIALDPQRGRVLLGSGRVADHASSPFLASFHYATAGAFGGGTYERTPAEPVSGPDLEVAGGDALQPQLDTLAGTGGRVFIDDSLTYRESPTVALDGVTDPDVKGLELVVSAKNGSRPLLSTSAEIRLEIGARGTLTLDGLVIAGAALRLPAFADNEPRTLILRDCTLVPGLALNPDGSAVSPGAPSLFIDHPFTTVKLERCITGPLLLAPDSDVSAELLDCVVDAVDPEKFALAGTAAGKPGAELTLRECTVMGRTSTRLLRLASNSIFVSKVEAARRQEGCMRFCFVAADSITPRRYHCQPDTAHPGAQPHFTSLRYADPGYCQLRGSTASAIRAGADDGGEMGVLHALFQPLRETNLALRLDEYLRFGLHAGLFYAT